MSYNLFISYFPSFDFLKPLFEKGSIRFKTWKKGEFICHSGSPLTRVIFFTSGRGRVYKTFSNGKEVMYDLYGPGNIAGDVEYITGGNTTCSLESSSNLAGYVMEKELLDQGVSDKLFKLLSKEVANKLVLNSTVQAVRLAYPLEERLAFRLINKSEDSFFSMEELAAELGAKYRHLSRIFNRLKANSVLSLKNKKVIILNREYLEKKSDHIKEDMLLY